MSVHPQNAITAVVAVLLVAVGALSWALALRAPLVVDASALAGFPTRLGDWSSVDVPADPAAEAMLRTDASLHREYSTPSGDSLWLYVGYYGTDRGGRPEHTPDACYRAHGWTTHAQRSLSVPGAPDLHVNESLVELGGEWQLIQYWYRSARSTGLLGGWDQAVDRLVGRLLTGRADGSVVRISTPLTSPDDAEAGRRRLLAFAAGVDAALAERWPVETAARDVAQSLAESPPG